LKIRPTSHVAFLPGVPPHEGDQKHRQPQGHGQRVKLSQAVLDGPGKNSQVTGDVPHEVHEAIQARIKQIMQMDEDVGKVAQATPILICTTLRLDYSKN